MRADGADGRPELVEVDARGMRCPLPVIEAAKAAAGRAPGTRLRVLSTDPASEHDLAAWAAMRGHTLDELTITGDLVTATITLG